LVNKLRPQFMQAIRCYRIHRNPESVIRLEPDPGVPAEPLTLVCTDEVRVSRSATGDALLYRDGPYGVQPDQAIRLGWCSLAEPEGASTSS